MKKKFFRICFFIAIN